MDKMLKRLTKQWSLDCVAVNYWPNMCTYDGPHYAIYAHRGNQCYSGTGSTLAAAIEATDEQLRASK